MCAFLGGKRMNHWTEAGGFAYKSKSDLKVLISEETWPKSVVDLCN
jgi:hypothetical protein